jgi:molybdate transport system permease protein
MGSSRAESRFGAAGRGLAVAELTRKRRARPLAALWVASLGLYLFAILPLAALLLRVSPAAFLRHLRDPVVGQALALSLGTSAAATGLCVLLGLPAAYVLARQRFAGREWLDTLVDLPITVPPVVAGVGLLLLFGRMGLLGRYLEAAGIRVAFTPLAVVLAQAFVATPFFVKAARAGFQALDPELEHVALTLGASHWQVWRHVTLPLVRPALLAGVTLAWARAMSEFGATLMFAGNLPGRTQTLPLAVMAAMDVDLDTALTLAAITLLVAGIALVGAKLLLRGEEIEW